MAIINVSKIDTFDEWRIKSNQLASEVGDNALLVSNPFLTSTNLVAAVNEISDKLDYEIGVIGDLTTNSSSLVRAINEHDAEIGDIDTLTTSSKITLVSAINELDSEVGALSGLTTTAKNTIVASINELDSDIGNLSSLNTSVKTSVVNSINSAVALETSRYSNTLKYDLTHSTVGGTNNSVQTILSNVSMPAGKTLTIDGTLDIANGTLIVGGAGGTLNIQTTFLALGDVNALVPSSGGVIVSRGKTAQNVPRPDTRIYWDETTKTWNVKRLDTDGTSVITPFILDSMNIGNLVSNGNIENGIAVTYDQNTNKLNFDVNDFTINLTGDIVGSGTVTNLGNVTINTTIPSNQVILGADTTGDYVATISTVTSSGIILAGNAGESAAVSISVDGTVVRTTGAQTIAGVKSFTNKPVFNDGFTASGTSTLANLQMTGDLTVGGSLTVNGTVTTVNTATLNLADNIITVNSDYVGTTPTENGGLEVHRGSLAKPSVLWNESTDKWTINDTVGTYSIIGRVNAGAGMIGGGEGPIITISHEDTSNQLSVDNSNGVVIQDIALDTFGHITSIGSYNLDDRYYTEAESDARYPLRAGTGASGTWGISVTGNAATSTTSTRWAAARTISLAGDLTGSVSLDGSANVTLSAEVLDNSHNHSISTLTNFREEVEDIVGAMFDAPNIENGISIYYNDDAGKMNADVNDFTITLTGGVSGSGVVNNLGNVSIPVTVNSSANATFANNAGALSGLVIHTGRNNEANKVVRTDGSGYLQVGYINSSSGNEGNNANPPRVWGTNGSDDYLRTYLTSALRVAYATSAGNADTVGGQSFAALEARYINASGDTMTGDLTTRHIYPVSNATFNIGHGSGRYNVMYANVFDGTAVRANYADLAEKYLPDYEYEVGTVVMIGGEKEVTASVSGVRALGVVSANPAYMMNQSLEGGIYIALKGRVPVKVVGSVNKGDRLYAADAGCASTIGDKADVFAIALESNNEESMKWIEAVVL